MAELRQLAEGVYAFLQPPLVWYSSVGVIVGDRDVILVDSLTNAAMTQILRAEIRRVTDKPIRYLVNTHWHPDHVFTNHLFPEATVIASHTTREKTLANQKVQGEHAALYGRSFPDIDFTGGRYTPQDVSFNGTLCLYQGEREVRLLELGPGHSESDVVVHLPREKTVFCGDVFVNGMTPLPGEGHVTQTIANYKALEALEADLYVAGHGDPGTLTEVRTQRAQLERLFHHARSFFDRGMSYDAALQTLADDGLPLGFGRMLLLCTYWELAGKRPESTDPAARDHMTMLQGVAAEAKLLLGRKGTN